MVKKRLSEMPTQEKGVGLRCRRCGCRHFLVVYTRHGKDVIVRRRACRNCGWRCTTREGMPDALEKAVRVLGERDDRQKEEQLENGNREVETSPPAKPEPDDPERWADETEVRVELAKARAAQKARAAKKPTAAKKPRARKKAKVAQKAK